MDALAKRPSVKVCQRLRSIISVSSDKFWYSKVLYRFMVCAVYSIELHALEGWGARCLSGQNITVLFWQAIFVGHNHGLDWCCPYEKMWLCFARHTGYGGYGNWPKGARIIQITENPFSTVSWIRMENGTKHSDVTLSSWICLNFMCRRGFLFF